MRVVGTFFTLLLIAGVSFAADEDAEKIEFLLQSVGSSECVFIRNGDEHSADDAEAHLRMKYRRGRKYVSSVDTFIERIATRSSWSGKPYRIRCGDDVEMATADWLRSKLQEFVAAARAHRFGRFLAFAAGGISDSSSGGRRAQSSCL